MISLAECVEVVLLYSQTCTRLPLLRPLKSVRLGQVVVLSYTFIKRPQTKSGRSWQVVSFYSHCEWFINNLKICWNKDLQFCVFWCHSRRLKMFLVTFDFEHTQVVFINECKFWEISNQMLFNVIFSFSETKGDLVMT